MWLFLARKPRSSHKCLSQLLTVRTDISDMTLNIKIHYKNFRHLLKYLQALIPLNTLGPTHFRVIWMNSSFQKSSRPSCLEVSERS